MLGEDFADAVFNGSYLLSKLTPEYGNDIGLYRGDGLAAFNKTPKQMENVKKHICKIFSEHNLKITIKANKKCVNYLDVTLDLRSQSFKPYIKPRNTPQHINRESNHPPTILRTYTRQISRQTRKNINITTQSSTTNGSRRSSSQNKRYPVAYRRGSRGGQSGHMTNVEFA